MVEWGVMVEFNIRYIIGRKNTPYQPPYPPSTKYPFSDALYPIPHI